jgi:hypothetical protein
MLLIKVYTKWDLLARAKTLTWQREKSFPLARQKPQTAFHVGGKLI